MYKTVRKVRADDDEGSENDDNEEHPCVDTGDMVNQEILEDEKFH